jgi:hypothetical protein
MKTQGLVFTILLALITSGCGSDTKTESSGQAVNKSVPPNTVRLTGEYLLGTWSSGCVKDQKRYDVYIQEYLQYDIGKVNRLTTSYLDSGCSIVLFQQNVAATYVLSSMGVYSETRKSAAITAQSSTGLNLFMMGDGYCGDHHWMLNVERTFTDVTDCGINSVAKLSLQAIEEGSISNLTARECEPRNPTNCTVMTYMRAN